MSKRVLVIGGVAGGASAAARLRRLDESAQITLFEQGPYISFANCALPYYIGDVISDEDELLLQSPEGMSRRYNIDVRVNSRVEQIDRARKMVTVKRMPDGESYEMPYDVLVLAPGAAPVRPPLPGVDSRHVYTLRNLEDAARIRRMVDSRRPDRVLVVGGGFIGVEMADNLAERGIHVDLVELSDQLLPPLDAEMSAYIHRAARSAGVELYLGKGLSSLEETENGMIATLSSGEKLTVQMAILAVGVKPDVPLAKQAGLALGPRGGIAVNASLQTSDPSIYAVGDAIEVVDFITNQSALIPLAGPANRQGRMAADAIAGREADFAPVQGTSIVKAFGMTAASVGANEKRLKAMGTDYEKVYLHPSSHASYYPGASTLAIKLLFSKPDGKILGAQAVGGEGVDKRIDVIATAQRLGATVHDLSQLELSYAPPFSSAKDPVNVAGFIAAAVLSGDAKIKHWDEVEGLDLSDYVLIDVRTRGERAGGHLADSLHIPVDQLRARRDEIPAGKPIVLYCYSGQRSYVAARMLGQWGFDAYNLSGGWRTYQTAKMDK